MNVTVVICTYNRCESLAEALESVAASKVNPSVEWEVLVVDNNSSDKTREVVNAFCARFPRFRYVFESLQGLSNARNAGIREARGSVIAFTDDDVVVDSQWLDHLTAPMLNHHWAGVGGRVLPKWTHAVPNWLQLGGEDSLSGTLVMCDHGPVALELAEPPFGASMAFRKTMFEKHGLFRTDLGRRPNSLLSNEDTEFGRRLLGAGERLFYEPAAVLYHPVTEDRLRKECFLAWWFDKGRSGIREFGIEKDAKRSFLGVPLYLIFDLARGTVHWMLTVKPSARFFRKIAVWEVAGQIAECRSLHHDKTDRLNSPDQNVSELGVK
jgi:glycosyltransferase involved in cell wall biosynthesis